MNIYNNDGNSTGRRASSCSYCRAPGHNATNCPRVTEDYAYFKKSPPVIPVGISQTIHTCHWYATPRYWGEWYGNCLKAHEKQLRAKTKASQSRTGVARSAPKCGFCGSKDHNRRNCETMDSYTADAIKANQKWRRAFYKKFVKDMGISEGALLNVGINQGYNKDDEEVIGVVTAINWDQLSLFCAAHDASRYCYRDDAYKQHLNVTVQLDNETKTISFGDHGIIDLDRSLVKYSSSGYHWGAPKFISVLSPSETPIGEEWIEEGHAKAMAFLTKKRSKAKLDEADVTKLIKKWL